MNLIPSIPASARTVINLLYDPQPDRLLIENILLVELSDGIAIDVGWYPHNDPNGSFRVTAYKDDWNNQLLPNPYVTTKPKEVAAIVETLAARFSSHSPPEAIPRTGGSYIGSSSVNSPCVFVRLDLFEHA